MKKFFVLALKLSVTSGILYYIFTLVPFSDIIQSFKSAKAGYILAALVISLAMRYLQAWQFKLLIDQHQVSLSGIEILKINLIVAFYQLFLPGYLSGGAVRWHKISRSVNKPVEALSSILFSRLIDTLVVVMLGIMFCALDKKSGAISIITPGLFLFSGLILYAFMFNKRVSSLLIEFPKKFKFKMIPDVVASKIHKLVTATAQYRDISRGNKINIFCLSLSSHLLGMLTWYLLALSINLNIPFVSVAWARSFVLIVTLLPISFSGIGVRETSLIVLLQPYGITMTGAVALSFLILGRSIFFSAIGGTLEAKEMFLAGRNKQEAR